MGSGLELPHRPLRDRAHRRVVVLPAALADRHERPGCRQRESRLHPATASAGGFPRAGDGGCQAGSRRLNTIRGVRRPASSWQGRPPGDIVALDQLRGAAPHHSVRQCTDELDPTATDDAETATASHRCVNSRPDPDYRLPRSARTSWSEPAPAMLPRCTAASAARTRRWSHCSASAACSLNPPRPRLRRPGALRLPDHRPRPRSTAARRLGDPG